MDCIGWAHPCRGVRAVRFHARMALRGVGADETRGYPSDWLITTMNLGRGRRRLDGRERLYDRVLVHRAFGHQP
jgi:hypothetical protein